MTTVEERPLERLRSSREITTVLRNGRRRRGRLLVMHVQDGQADVTRVAVTASRRVGTAVARNRAKRILREASRRVDWTERIDVVLVARAECAVSRTDEVTEELEQLAGDLGVVGSSQ